MRYLTFLAIIGISISCQRKNNNQDSHNLLYAVDTVIIESKGRLLDLNRRLFFSDLNEEESSIFLFNTFDHSIDEVNLDNLEITNNFSFEVDGPDGTGEHINNFNLSKDGSFFIKTFNKSALFDRNGHLSIRIDWVNAVNSNGLKFGEFPRNEFLIDDNGLKVFGLSHDLENRDVFLDILFFEDKKVKRFDIDPKKSYHNFVLTVDNPMSFLDPFVHLRYENNFIIVSHQFSNELYLFNSKGEFVQIVNYEPKMTPKRVKDLIGDGISSDEQLKNEYQHFLEQVRFGPPVWDKEKKRYLRLSAKWNFKDRRKEDALLPEIQEVEVYLSIFDAEFNLISESAISELNSEFVKYFAKDGKLWVYQNFSDELGFIVINF
ncbi:MAG: DUF4221 family protein [Cyclobacteriaceae bacterium]